MKNSTARKKHLKNSIWSHPDPLKSVFILNNGTSGYFVEGHGYLYFL